MEKSELDCLLMVSDGVVKDLMVLTLKGKATLDCFWKASHRNAKSLGGTSLLG